MIWNFSFYILKFQPMTFAFLFLKTRLSKDRHYPRIMIVGWCLLFVRLYRKIPHTGDTESLDRQIVAPIALKNFYLRRSNKKKLWGQFILFIFFFVEGVQKYGGDQWEAWNWSCDLRANERPWKNRTSWHRTRDR